MRQRERMRLRGLVVVAHTPSICFSATRGTTTSMMLRLPLPTTWVEPNFQKATDWDEPRNSRRRRQQEGAVFGAHKAEPEQVVVAHVPAPRAGVRHWGKFRNERVAPLRPVR